MINAPLPDSAGTDPSLRELLASVWQRRGWILCRLVVAGLLVVAIVGSVYFFRPSQRQAELAFRLTFTGLEQGSYPNKTRFSPADIVSLPVLEEVYNRRQLKEQVTFADFRDSFAVLGHNPALTNLRLEYRPRLAQTGLTQVERIKLEDDYEARIAALRGGEFVLVLKPNAPGQLRWVSRELAEEVLKVWLEQAREQGAFRFDLDVYSRNILADLGAYRDDYLVTIDRMRVTITRVLANIERLDTVHGAALVRAGPRNISIDELQARLRDDLKYKLSLIEGPIYGLGLFRSRNLAEDYIGRQLFRLGQETAALRIRSTAMDRALADYAANWVTATAGTAGAVPGTGAATAFMPQISESFLNRMLDLPTQRSDVAFRQNLARQALALGEQMAELGNETQVYENMRRQLNGSTPELETKREPMQAWVDRQLAAMTENLGLALDDIQALYGEVSRRSLEPPNVYAITEGFHWVRISALGIGQIAVVLAMVWILYAGFTVLQVVRQRLYATDPFPDADSVSHAKRA
jgi:hypothetical protein